MLNLNAPATTLRHTVTFSDNASRLPSFELKLARVPQQGESLHFDHVLRPDTEHAGRLYDGSWVVEQVQTDIAIGEHSCDVSYTVYLRAA